MKFICPKCKEEQNCPCENCQERNEGKITWIWIDGNGPIKCGHCGHTMSVDEWMHEEMRQFEEFKEAEKENKVITMAKIKMVPEESILTNKSL